MIIGRAAVVGIGRGHVIETDEIEIAIVIAIDETIATGQVVGSDVTNALRVARFSYFGCVLKQLKLVPDRSVGKNLLF